MKQFVVIFLILTICIASTCNKNPFAKTVYSIFIQNESEKPILFLVSEDYPDTSIPDSRTELVGVTAGGRTPYDFHVRNWSEVFDRLPQDTLSIFIFSGDTLANNTWQDIRTGYKILKRYDLSQQDIKNMNPIVYP